MQSLLHCQINHCQNQNNRSDANEVMLNKFLHLFTQKHYIIVILLCVLFVALQPIESVPYRWSINARKILIGDQFNLANKLTLNSFSQCFPKWNAPARSAGCDRFSSGTVSSSSVGNTWSNVTTIFNCDSKTVRNDTRDYSTRFVSKRSIPILQFWSADFSLTLFQFTSDKKKWKYQHRTAKILFGDVKTSQSTVPIQTIEYEKCHAYAVANECRYAVLLLPERIFIQNLRRFASLDSWNGNFGIPLTIQMLFSYYFSHVLHTYLLSNISDSIEISNIPL